MFSVTHCMRHVLALTGTLCHATACRVETAHVLAAGLPVKYGYDAILAETIFSQLMLLPAPPLKPVAYATLLMDVCKLTPEFPKYLAAWIRSCFNRMPYLDPALRLRLAEYLAHHLSNFGFSWPWQKWEGVLKAPPTDAQRGFCVSVIAHMIGLSYWKFAKEVCSQWDWCNRTAWA